MCVVHVEADWMASEVVDKGKGISTEEEKTAVEAEADPEDDLETLIMPGKRRRKDVDYSKVGRPLTKWFLMSGRSLEGCGSGSERGRQG